MVYVPVIVFGQNFSTSPSNSTTLNPNSNIDLSGLYISNNQDKYFLKQMGNSVWWIGTEKNGSQITNIFKGTIEGDKIIGQWIDSPIRMTNGSGDIRLNLFVNSSEDIAIKKVFNNDKMPWNQLIKFNPKIHIVPKIMIILNGIRIDIPRSPTQDILYTGIGVWKNKDETSYATRYLAARGENSNINLNINLGPFNLDEKDKGIYIEFLGVDNAFSQTSAALIYMRDALTQLLDPSYNVTSIYQAESIISSLAPGLLPGGCNGVVFADKIFLPMDNIKKMVTNGTFTQEKFYFGSESPPGCGANSKYYVKWSIVPVEG